MPLQEIAVMSTGEDGSVDAYLSVDSTNAILIVLSVTVDRSLEHLDVKMVIRDGVLYLEHEYQLNDDQLINTSWIELIAGKLIAVGRAIHDNPTKPNKSVFQSIGIKQSDVELVLKTVRERPALFKSIGLYDFPDLNRDYLEPIKNIVSDDEMLKTRIVSIAAVCARDIQPSVFFFKYTKENVLQKNGYKYTRIECATTVEQVTELFALFAEELAMSQTKQLLIRYRKGTRGGFNELISYRILQGRENEYMDFGS